MSEGNENYTNFLQLLDIMDIVMSPKLANEHIIVLEDLIRQFVNKFTELYPDVQTNQQISSHGSFSGYNKVARSTSKLLVHEIRSFSQYS